MLGISRQKAARAATLAAVALLTALLASGCGGRRSDQHRELGDTYFRLGQLTEAMREYEAAIQANPENAGAHFGAGRTHRARDSAEEALESFQRATEAQPDFEAAYAEAARYLIELGRPDEALAWAERFADAAPIDGGILKAFILLESGAPGEAVASLEELIEGRPDSVRLHVTLGAVQLAANQPASAEQTLRRVLDELDSASLPARMALIEVHHAQDNLEEAISEYQHLVEQQQAVVDESPGDAEAQELLRQFELTLARSLLEDGQVDAAEALAEPIVQDMPGSGWANYIMGAIYVEREQYADAIPYLQTAQRALPQQPEVDRQLTFARRGGDDAPASPTPTETAEAPSAEEADWEDLWRQARVRTLVEQRNAVASAGDTTGREAVAAAALFLDDLELAAELAQELPGDSPLREFISLVTAEQYQDVMNFLDSWEETTPRRRVLKQNVAAYTYSQLGMRARAFNTFALCLDEWPEDGMALYNLAGMYQRADMPEFMIGTLQRLVSIHPRSLDNRMMLLRGLVNAGRYEEARNYAESVYGIFPREPDAIIGLAHAYTNTGDAALAEDVLKRAIQNNPDEKRLQIALVEVLLHRESVGPAVELATELVRDSSHPAETSRAAAFAFARNGDWDAARGAAGNPPGQADLAVHLLKAAAELHGGDPDQALETLQNAANALPGQAHRIAPLRAALGDTVELRAPAQQAIAELLEEADSAVLVEYIHGQAAMDARFFASAYDRFAWVHGELGSPGALLTPLMASLAHPDATDDPAETARELAESHSDAVQGWLGLADVLEAHGDSAGAEEALEQAIAVAPDHLDALFALAQHAEEQGNDQLALETYRRLYELEPSHPVVNNNLAYFILHTGEDPNEALSLAETAQSQLQAHPNVLHTLGLAQLRTGRFDEAQRNLGFALELRPGDPTVLLDFGHLLAAIDREEEGRLHAELAIQYADQLDLDFPRRSEAEELAAAG